jgi:hypothetical protein
MKKRGSDPLKVQQWTSRLARFKTSRLSVARFCQDEGVSIPSFYQWKKKLAERHDAGRRPVAKSQGRAVAADRETPSQRSGDGSFQTVQLIPSGEVAAGVTLRLPGGVQLTLGDNLPAIEMVVEKLLRGVSREAGGPAC